MTGNEGLAMIGWMSLIMSRVKGKSEHPLKL